VGWTTGHGGLGLAIWGLDSITVSSELRSTIAIAANSPLTAGMMEMAGLEPAAFCLQCVQHQAACYAAKTQVGGEPLGVAARPTWVTRSTHHQFRSLLDRLDLAVTVVTAGALHSPCQHADCLITGEHAGMRSPTAMRGRPTGAVASERTPLACLPRSKVVQWAWLDLNQRPHPYQLNAGNRCADHRLRRSRTTVGVKGMRSIGAQVCVLLWRSDAR
jgi:hypothetical protein